MKYKDYSVRDFIEDEYFQNWVFGNDKSIHSFWEEWVHHHPHKKSELEQARKLLQSIRFEQHTLSNADVSAIWKQIQDNTQERIESGEKKRNGYKVQISVAASFFLAIILAGTYYATHYSKKSFHTAFGETKRIALPDGSSVVLNANSTLTIDHSWNEVDPREVTLDGEAFFEVTHKHSSQAFRVHASEDVMVEVLGTTFNVYHRTQATKVVLNSGQIRLNLPKEAASGSIIMRPGEMIEYKSQKYNKKAVDPSHYNAWTSNKIILDHTSLQDMIQLIHDTYGLDVVVSNPALLKQTVSGSMPLGDSEVLLSQMAKAFQLHIERKGDQIKVSEIR